MKSKKFVLSAALVTSVFAFAGRGYSEDVKAPTAPKKKAEGHCQVTKDGKSKDIDAPADAPDPKKWCKEQGGMWEKGKKHDDHK